MRLKGVAPLVRGGNCIEGLVPVPAT